MMGALVLSSLPITTTTQDEHPLVKDGAAATGHFNIIVKHHKKNHPRQPRRQSKLNSLPSRNSGIFVLILSMMTIQSLLFCQAAHPQRQHQHGANNPHHRHDHRHRHPSWLNRRQAQLWMMRHGYGDKNEHEYEHENNPLDSDPEKLKITDLTDDIVPEEPSMDQAWENIQNVVNQNNPPVDTNDYYFDYIRNRNRPEEEEWNPDQEEDYTTDMETDPAYDYDDDDDYSDPDLESDEGIFQSSSRNHHVDTELEDDAPDMEQEQEQDNSSFVNRIRKRMTRTMSLSSSASTATTATTNTKNNNNNNLLNDPNQQPQHPVPHLAYRYYRRRVYRHRTTMGGSVPFVLLGPNVDHWKQTAEELAGAGFSSIACERVPLEDDHENRQQSQQQQYSLDHHNIHDNGATNARVILDLLDALRWNRAVLVACDEEAVLAIQAALHLTDRIVGIVLCGRMVAAQEWIAKMEGHDNNNKNTEQQQQMKRSNTAAWGMFAVDRFLQQNVICPSTIIWDGDERLWKEQYYATFAASTSSSSSSPSSLSPQEAAYLDSLAQERTTVRGSGLAPHRRQPEYFSWILTRFVEQQVAPCDSAAIGIQQQHANNNHRHLYENDNTHNNNLHIVAQKHNFFRQQVAEVFSQEGRVVVGRIVASAILYGATLKVGLYQYQNFRNGIFDFHSKLRLLSSAPAKLLGLMGGLLGARTSPTRQDEDQHDQVDHEMDSDELDQQLQVGEKDEEKKHVEEEEKDSIVTEEDSKDEEIEDSSLEEHQSNDDDDVMTHPNAENGDDEEKSTEEEQEEEEENSPREDETSDEESDKDRSFRPLFFLDSVVA